MEAVTEIIKQSLPLFFFNKKIHSKCRVRLKQRSLTLDPPDALQHLSPYWSTFLHIQIWKSSNQFQMQSMQSNPLHTNFQGANFQRCKLVPGSHCSVLLYFSRYCTVRFKMLSLFLVFAFMYYLWGKYYKSSTVQYYIANRASWVPRLTVLDLWTNWPYACVLGTELICE